MRRRADDLLRQGRYEDAVHAYRALLAVAPQQADAWYNLGYTLATMGRPEEALQAYDGALRAGVRNPHEVHLNRAVLYSDHLRCDERAEQALREALALDEAYLPAYLNLGNLHEERGEREPALACYERILDLSKGSTNEQAQEALARMAHLQPPCDLDDPLLRRLRSEAEQAAVAPIRANLWFALGRALDRLGAYRQAFEAFVEANRSSRTNVHPGYERARQERLFGALRDAFDLPSVLACRDSTAHHRAAPAPLFICGMFRSGSTLLEQALAAHPAVFPGGELALMARFVAGPLAPFPASMRSLSPDRSSALAAEYREQLVKLFPQAREKAYITDKRPDNFQLVGLIKRLFPDAKILHSMRDPLDNGLSVFMQHLDPRVAPYAGSLADIGHYYVQYRALMAHWKALYPGDIHDFDYDAFVQEPRPTLERVLAFLGLPWDERCMAFDRVGNSVKTASYWQVRQPLYREASGRWQHYADQLAPFRHALACAGVLQP